MNSQNNGYRRLCFADSLYGYASTNSNMIFKTTNSGENWFALNLNSGYGINGMYALNRDTLFVSGNSGRIYRSMNGVEIGQKVLLQTRGKICGTSVLSILKLVI